MFDRPRQATELARFEESVRAMCIVVVELSPAIAICSDQLVYSFAAEVAWRGEVMRRIRHFHVREVQHSRQPTLLRAKQVVVPQIVMADRDARRAHALI